MGCKNSTLIRRRESKKPSTAMPEKIVQNEFIQQVSTDINRHYVQSDVDIIQSKLESISTDIHDLRTDSRGGSPKKLRKQREPKQSCGFHSALSFKILKRSAEKLNFTNATSGTNPSTTTTTSTSKCVSVEKSSTDSDVAAMLRQCKEIPKRKLSTPTLSAPTIIVDEVQPPPSAPPNGLICSTSTMWDMLTSRQYEESDDLRQQQQRQPIVNGIQSKNPNKLKFGRQRSADKLVAQMKDAEAVLSDDWVLKIIRCFPFPSPKQSPRNSPPVSPKALTGSATFESCQQTPSTSSSNESSIMKPGSRTLRCKLSDPTSGAGSGYFALGLMVRKTIETAFPPLIPWDVWLRKRLANWTQCSGHEGTIVPATEKTVWKKCENESHEANAYRKLMDDSAADIVPKFYKEVEHKGEFFMELEDLSRNFVDPCIMDVKMGTRTFLECEVENQKKRPDLYDKMMAIDENEPSASERVEKAITKLRYMTFREQMSSTASMGFRIDAAKMAGGELQKDFQKIRTREQIKDIFRLFFGPNHAALRRSLLVRLRLMRQKVEQSEFFHSHEVIGSSVLIIHDSKNVNAWIIDFAKALPIQAGSIDHRTQWALGNHEDGYLFGLDNLIQIIEEIDSCDQGSYQPISSNCGISQSSCPKSKLVCSNAISFPFP